MASSSKAVPQTAEPVVLPVAVPVTQPTPEQNGAHQEGTGSATNVAKEQRFIKSKSKRISQFFRGVKAGEVQAEVPSNNQVEAVLTGGANGIDRFQNSERGANLTEQNQKVLSDVKEILVHENAILQERNDQEQLQTFVKHGAVVAKDITNNPLVKEIIQRWKAELTEAMRTKNFKGMAQLGDDVITTLRQTEAFLELTVEIGKLVRILNNRLGGERSVVLEERDAVLSELRTTLKVLSSNRLWNQAVSMRDPVPQDKKDDLRAMQGAVNQDHLQQLSDSGQALLQAMVGDKVSVQPFIDATVTAIRFVMSDRQLVALVSETQELCTQISENPGLADDMLTQARMRLMLDKLEFAASSLINHECVRRARTEGDKLVAVIKEDPMNQALLTDIRKLRADANPADILSGLRTFIVPLIIEHLNNIPLSTIKTTVNVFGLGTTEVEISNLRLALRDFLPKDLHVKLEYTFDGDMQELKVSQQKLVAKIAVKNLHININDAAWKYTRGENSDQGKASFHTSGKGISLSLVMAIEPYGAPMITVEHAKCKMDKFNLTFYESQHNKFYSFLTHVGSGRIRKNVQETMNNKMKEMGPALEAKLKEMFGQSKTKLEEVRTNVQKRAETRKAKKEQKRAAKAQAAAPVVEGEASGAEVPEPVPSSSSEEKVIMVEEKVMLEKVMLEKVMIEETVVLEERGKEPLPVVAVEPQPAVGLAQQ